MYAVRMRRRVEKQIAALPRPARTKLWEEIEALAENPFPHGYLKLRGYQDTYRIRIGDYRVIYSVDTGELVIEVLTVGHRREVYD